MLEPRLISPIYINLTSPLVTFSDQLVFLCHISPKGQVYYRKLAFNNFESNCSHEVWVQWIG